MAAFDNVVDAAQRRVAELELENQQIRAQQYVGLYSIVPCSHMRLKIITSVVVMCVHTCESHVNPLSRM